MLLFAWAVLCEVHTLLVEHMLAAGHVKERGKVGMRGHKVWGQGRSMDTSLVPVRVRGQGVVGPAVLCTVLPFQHLTLSPALPGLPGPVGRPILWYQSPPWPCLHASLPGTVSEFTRLVVSANSRTW